MPTNKELSMASPTRLQLFGQFRLVRSGQEIDGLGRKARAILAYLVLVPGFTATREHLSGLLWTDRGTEQARASLRQCLRELRAIPLAGFAVCATRNAVSLDRGTLVADLHEIRRTAAQRDLATLARQLDEARGDLLEDLTGLSPAFDDWLAAERPRQRDLVLADILEAVEASGFAQVKHARAILRALDRLDPANEAVVRLGMRIEHVEGDSAAIHRRYRVLAERLDKEFSVRPSGETKVLHDQLTSGRPVAPAAAHLSDKVELAPIPALFSGGDMLPLVMVSPVRTAGTDPVLDALVDFCADDVRTALSRNRGLRVLAVDSADLSQTIQASQDALGLYLLKWNGHQLGKSLRVNIQLVNATSGIIIWSDSLRFDGADESMIDPIVEKAAGAVSPAIDRDLDAMLHQSFQGFDEERVLYTRARLLIRRVAHLAAVQEAVELLERLIAANPQHMGARLQLIRMYSTDFWQQIAGHDVRLFRQLADEHLQAAVASEPTNCEVRIRKGWSHLRKGQTELARQEFDAVLDNLPRDAEIVDLCAFGLCHIGLYDAAERLMQRAFFLNPFPPSDYHADYAVLLALRGEAEMAEEYFMLSGETGLQYNAVRIANSSAIRNGVERLADCRKQFIEGFDVAWQPERAPLIEDVLTWFGYTMPLFPKDRLHWVLRGLREMLEPCWPAPCESAP